jgi:hypothetical protein
MYENDAHIEEKLAATKDDVKLSNMMDTTANWTVPSMLDFHVRRK